MAGLAVKFPFRRPDLGAFADRARQEEARAGLTATFLGVSTILFDDGETALMTDGFFTRPSLRKVGLGAIAPDEQTIDACLTRAGARTLAAVICAHSHYDHAMDAPVVADRTGAVLVGSASTANIGRGWGLAEDRLVVAEEGAPLRFGAFTVRVVESTHSPGDHFPGAVEAPLVPPAKAKAWRTGECYSIFLDHGERTALVHASANYRPGALAGERADVVYLGVAPLGKQSAKFRDAYWDEVVAATGARRVIPVHWDDFFRPLTKPLKPLFYAADDFDVVMRFLLDRGDRAGVDVVLPSAWRRTDPFAGL